MGHGVEEEIEGVRQKWVDNDFMKFISALESLVSIFQKLCNMTVALSALNEGLGMIWGGLAVVEDIPIIGKLIASVGRALSLGGGTTLKGAELVVEKLCLISTCRTFEAIGGKVGNVADNIADTLYATPEESIISSFLTLCLPGILYNIDKGRQIECRYAHA